ncbi:hypothetical protein MTQ01_01940 [Streptomyces sp. XM4193]|uniref:hypothetical protein n=1 Tax=Streptomyces sp. XM4193 TaxID=2929782 RepID=UPI001FF73332|nr:hypothetical protein [Streptomyces sp. XM4193]MCK1794805.1 hypothetical protein [Streptomyces sp. XM4193]
MSEGHVSRRTLLGLAAVAGTATLAGCAEGGGKEDPPSKPSSEPGRAWDHLHLAEDWGGEYVSLAATDRDNVWALGVHGLSSDEPAGTRLFLDHWDGRKWREHELPDELPSGEGHFGLTAAGRGDGVWLVARSKEGELHAHRWDGDAWRTLPRTAPAKPAGPDFSGTDIPLVAAEPDLLWLVLDGEVRHWSGSGWQAPALTFTATDLAVLPSSDGGTPKVWAVGRTATECEDGECYPQPASARWGDGGWSPVEMPAYRFPDPVPPEASAGLDAVVADDDRLWALGRHDFNHGEVEDEPEAETILLTGDGTGWSKSRLPRLNRAVSTATTVADGHGGLLLDHGRHLTADGKLHRVAWPPEVPGPGEGGSPSPGGRRGKQQMNWNVACRVPGTAKILAAGAVLAPNDSDGTTPRRATVVQLELPDGE